MQANLFLFPEMKPTFKGRFLDEDINRNVNAELNALAMVTINNFGTIFRKM
jgi:hypothetical protein